MNITVMSACYSCQRKAEKGGDAVASLTDDNAVLAGIASAHYCDINATLYETDFPLYEAWGDCPKPGSPRASGSADYRLNPPMPLRL